MEKKEKKKKEVKNKTIFTMYSNHKNMLKSMIAGLHLKVQKILSVNCRRSLGFVRFVMILVGSSSGKKYFLHILAVELGQMLDFSQWHRSFYFIIMAIK